MTNRTGNIGSALAVAFAVFFIDRLLKLAVESFFRVGESVILIPGLLRLTYVTNSGGAFGSLPGRGVFLIFGSLLAVGVVFYVLAKGSPSGLATVGGGLILGGTAGNLVDRVVSGQVTDYLQLIYVFNAADFAIIAGLVALLVAALRGRKRGSEGA